MAAKPEYFRSIFNSLMLFAMLVWLWTIALIFSWPWDKSGQWAPDLRVAAACANNEVCSVPYGELAAAKAKGSFTTLALTGESGEKHEGDAWLRWEKVTGQAWQYEVKRSSWHYETVVRYRLEGETPVLVQKRNIDTQLFIFALPLAAFTMLGLRLRRLRR
jgi:hypothetical protein